MRERLNRQAPRVVSVAKLDRALDEVEMKNLRAAMEGRPPPTGREIYMTGFNKWENYHNSKPTKPKSLMDFIVEEIDLALK